jgi:hypothetical protein
VLTVTCFYWGNKYPIKDVYKLRLDVMKHLRVPHEFKVITDNAAQFGNTMNTVKLIQPSHDGRDLCNKLFLYHPFAREMIGQRILNIDIDSLIVGRLDELVNRDEPLVLWRNPRKVVAKAGLNKFREHYNTSLVLVDGGAFPQIWDDFNREKPICKHDQAYVSYKLGPDMPSWGPEDGVYRLRVQTIPTSGIDSELPKNARIVFFPGNDKATDPKVQARAPWIGEYL